MLDIAITGASGVIGTVLRKGLRGSYRLTSIDLTPIKDEHEVLCSTFKVNGGKNKLRT